jgi:hypothetical protein
MEIDRFNFLVERDGLVKALDFERELIRTYRKTVLSRFGPKPKMTLYRRGLIERYLQAKRIIKGTNANLEDAH